jgi:tetratricopeptide (TPR) repeat protein
MKQVCLIVLCLFCAATGAFASVNDSLIKANAWYNKGEYSKAIRLYEYIVERGYQSDELFYNLGNAYYKTGQVGESILNYERALVLNPGLEDAEQNLKIAGLSTVDRFEVMPQPLLTSAYQSIFKLFSPGSWAVLALCLLAISGIGVALYFFSSAKRLAFIVAAVCLGLFVATLAMAYQHHNYRQKNKAAIVMTASSYAKSGPSEKAEDVFILHEGTKAVVIESFGLWHKVRLPDGKIGWMKQADLQLVQPVSPAGKKKASSLRTK